MKKIKYTNGVSRLVVLLAVIAALLIMAIIIPKVAKSTDEKAEEADSYYVIAAEKEAERRWMETYEAFSAYYDAENKKLKNTASDAEKIKPYGTSKNHEKKIVFVSVDDEGKIKTTWIEP